MKFVQIMEYKMKNIFLQTSVTKGGEETTPRLFYKKSKVNLFLDQHSEMLKSLFIFHVQVGVYKNTVY